jgi:hypothetical protein
MCDGGTVIGILKHQNTYKKLWWSLEPPDVKQVPIQPYLQQLPTKPEIQGHSKIGGRC